MVSIAVLDDYQQVARSMADWDALDAEITVFTEHLPDGDAVVAALAGFDLVVAMRERTPFPADVLRRLPNVRCLITTGMRNAVIDLAAAAECGITVCGTGGAGSPTSELAWALILSMFRDVAADDARVRAGGWQHGVGHDLAGQTLGLVGLGRLGRQVARVGLAFDMRVLAWSEHLTDERAAEAGVTRVDKRQLFAPHLGYVSDDSYRAFYTQAVDDAAAYLAGHPIRTLQ